MWKSLFCDCNVNMLIKDVYPEEEIGELSKDKEILMQVWLMQMKGMF